ncbi:hypothetical protein BU16DRAFT_557461 [Lophium mytilinum]|uniref:Uncharacterized protein n=1 Tax=Lophium mytilinum TaxID=390894 RepID=A0A6A6R314_9PEZI|nr:hypothetical protein BU16DRAFT_557461 [Lophium mytilinum]
MDRVIASQGTATTGLREHISEIRSQAPCSVVMSNEKLVVKSSSAQWYGEELVLYLIKPEPDAETYALQLPVVEPLDQRVTQAGIGIDSDAGFTVRDLIVAVVLLIRPHHAGYPEELIFRETPLPLDIGGNWVRRFRSLSHASALAWVRY